MTIQVKNERYGNAFKLYGLLEDHEYKDRFEKHINKIDSIIEREGKLPEFVSIEFEETFLNFVKKGYLGEDIATFLKTIENKGIPLLPVEDEFNPGLIARVRDYQPDNLGYLRFWEARKKQLMDSTQNHFRNIQEKITPNGLAIHIGGTAHAPYLDMLCEEHKVNMNLSYVKPSKKVYLASDTSDEFLSDYKLKISDGDEHFAVLSESYGIKQPVERVINTHAKDLSSKVKDALDEANKNLHNQMFTKTLSVALDTVLGHAKKPKNAVDTYITLES